MRTQGVGTLRVFFYATLPQVLPLLMVACVDALSFAARRWLTR